MFLVHAHRFLPIIKNSVLFKSFKGQYNDSPKQISILLHKIRPDIKQYWAIDNGTPNELPDYVEQVNVNSPFYVKLVYRSNVVIENYSGVRFYLPKKGKRMSLIRRLLSKKRKGQLDISTWHGTPLKKIAGDEPNTNDDYEHLTSSCNYFLSGSTYTKEALLKAFKNKIPVVMYGTPRNDIFFREHNYASIKEKLGISPNKKVILFAPTFRNEVFQSGITQMQSIDFQLLFNCLTHKFGGDWVFVYRFHNLVREKLDSIIESVAHFKQGQIIDGNKCPDMADYLIVSDILLTDYSSSMFDFALTKRPCFLFCPDLSYYRSKERGMYLSIECLPFPISETFEELIFSFESFDSIIYKKRIEELNNVMNQREDGNATNRVVNDIDAFCKKRC